MKLIEKFSEKIAEFRKNNKWLLTLVLTVILLLLTTILIIVIHNTQEIARIKQDISFMWEEITSNINYNLSTWLDCTLYK